MNVSLSLSNRVALITGGSRGIGAATVRLFSAAGALVLFNYRKAHAEAKALAKECGEERCAAVQCDLTGLGSARAGQVALNRGTGTAQALVNAAVQRFGRLDI